MDRRACVGLRSVCVGCSESAPYHLSILPCPPNRRVSRGPLSLSTPHPYPQRPVRRTPCRAPTTPHANSCSTGCWFCHWWPCWLCSHSCTSRWACCSVTCALSNFISGHLPNNRLICNHSDWFSSNLTNRSRPNIPPSCRRLVCACSHYPMPITPPLHAHCESFWNIVYRMALRH